MPGRYQVLVIDLDGTLLSSDGTVSAGNRSALARARGAGLTIIVATGRSLSESRLALQAIGYEGLMIAAGGAQLCDVATGRTLERQVMAVDVVERVTAIMAGHGHRTLLLKDHHAAGYDYLLVGTQQLDAASAWWFDKHDVRRREADRLEHDEHPEDSLRAGVVASNGEIDGLARELRSELHDAAYVQHWPAVSTSQVQGAVTHLLEVFHPAVNKWTMVETFCRHHGFDPATVAAIGDGLNDVELIENAGLGVAMGNALREVTEVADRVTGHHDEDGVAQAVDGVLEERET